MGRTNILPSGKFDLSSVADIQRRSAGLRILVMAIMALVSVNFIDWRYAACWFAAYLLNQAWCLTSGYFLSKGGRAAAVSFCLSCAARYMLLSAPSWLMWRDGGQLGVAAATMLNCGLLVQLVVYTMGLPLLFWACAAPLFAQLILLPVGFYGMAHPQQGFCGAVCGLLLVGYFGLLWRTWRVSLRQIEEGQRAALAKSVEADRANAAKSEFLATMSHELRTPLNGMLGIVQALVRTPLSEPQHEMVATIDEAGLCLLTVLDGLLDVAKLDAGRLTLHPAPFRLDLLLRRAAALFSAAALEKGLDLKVELDPGCAHTLIGDAARIRQIVVNLLSNAVKFTSAGEIALTASVAVFEDRARLRVSVRDTGEGMAPAVHERLFRRFEQADSSATRQAGGTGLGLAIARDLTDLMGGELKLQSALGQGARFDLILDLPVSAQALIEADGAGAFGPVVETTAEVTEARPCLRVLAAEDNPTNQLVLRTLLAPLGIELIMVDDGAKALELWTRQGFDLVLMDLHMPVMDGLAATRAIRERERAQGLRPTPIVAVTADAMSDCADRCRAAGMTGHVAKPVRLDRLLNAMDIALADAGGGGGDGLVERAA
ncbi:MAG: ATP-binding protein [Caulobacteraceae bacterium]